VREKRERKSLYLKEKKNSAWEERKHALDAHCKTFCLIASSSGTHSMMNFTSATDAAMSSDTMMWLSALCTMRGLQKQNYEVKAITDSKRTVMFASVMKPAEMKGKSVRRIWLLASANSVVSRSHRMTSNPARAKSAENSEHIAITHKFEEILETHGIKLQ
jgi:hypothetical protein